MSSFLSLVSGRVRTTKAAEMAKTKQCKGVTATLDSHHLAHKRRCDGRYASSYIVAETLGGTSGSGREYLRE